MIECPCVVVTGSPHHEMAASLGRRVTGRLRDGVIRRLMDPVIVLRGGGVTAPLGDWVSGSPGDVMSREAVMVSAPVAGSR